MLAWNEKYGTAGTWYIRNTDPDFYKVADNEFNLDQDPQHCNLILLFCSFLIFLKLPESGSVFKIRIRNRRPLSMDEYETKHCA